MWAQHKKTGFTIVELLIVIVVIAILAVITIVAFNGVQQRSRANMLSSSLAQAKKKLSLYQVDNAGYPTTGSLAAAGISNSSGVTYQYTSDGTTYCLTASSSGTSYNVTQAAAPSSGACSGQVEGGVITNYITNPGMTINTTGWYAWPGGNGAITSSRVPAGWTVRGYAYQASYTTANTTSYQGTNGWNIPSTPTAGIAMLEENTTYTAMWKVRSSVSQRVRPDFGNARALGGANGTGTYTILASSGEGVIPANTTTTQWVTFTTGPSTVAGYIFTTVRSGTGAVFWNAGDYWQVGEMTLVKSTQTHPYADGATTDWKWDGATEASTSSGPVL